MPGMVTVHAALAFKDHWDLQRRGLLGGLSGCLQPRRSGMEDFLPSSVAAHGPEDGLGPLKHLLAP